MHWIENLFGIDPDGNSGATEAAFFIVICVVLWAVRRVLPGKRHGTNRASH